MRADALREVHDRHAAVIWRYVISLTGNPADADDIVQETLLKAWRQPSLLDDDPDRIRAWMFTVARNMVIDQARSARRRYEHAGEEPGEAAADDGTDQLFDRMLLHDALGSLGEQHREVIVRAYYGGRSTTELAEELDVAEGTVKSRLHYGLRALRLAFQERGVTR